MSKTVVRERKQSKIVKSEISVGKGIVIGATIGLITAALGAYKDTTFEGFSMRTFWRSPIIAAIYGGIGSQLFPKNKSVLLLAGFCSTAERITIETYKATTGRVPGKFEWGVEGDRGWIWKRITET